MFSIFKEKLPLYSPKKHVNSRTKTMFQYQIHKKTHKYLDKEHVSITKLISLKLKGLTCNNLNKILSIIQAPQFIVISTNCHPLFNKASLKLFKCPATKKKSLKNLIKLNGFKYSDSLHQNIAKKHKFLIF